MTEPRHRPGDSPPRPHPDVTMRDVAMRAGGVHPSTVSLALRNDPAIPLATRRRIQRAARAAGYRRDPLLDAFNARRASHDRRRTIPVIAFVSDSISPQDSARSLPYAALWRGAQLAAESLFHRLDPFWIGPNSLNSSRLDSVLYARGITGLLTAAIRPGSPQLAIAWERYSPVKIDALDWPAPNRTVAVDYLQGARLAFRQAKSLGYARIGLLLDPISPARNDLFRAGHLIELHESEPHGTPFISQRTDPADVRRWIRRNRLDAVLAAVPHPELLLSAAKPVPRIGWACLAPEARPPGVAGLAADFERLGALAVEQLVSLMRTHQTGLASNAMTTFLPLKWQPGASLPDRRAPAA